MRAVATLYEKDFFAWTQEQVKLIKDKAFNKLDIEHIQDEIESMGNQNKSELRNRLAVLLMHLLKWKYQAELRRNSWRITIVNQRLDIADLIEDNPSLQHFLSELFTKAYNNSIVKTNVETGIKKTTFPQNCEWAIEQVLDNEFFPN